MLKCEIYTLWHRWVPSSPFVIPAIIVYSDSTKWVEDAFRAGLELP